MKVFVVAIALLLGGAVAAHEMKLADGREVDYAGMRSPSGSDCCGNRDCSVVEWREIANGGLELFLPGLGWRPAPSDKMLPPHPDAPDLAHACWQKHSQLPRIQCWMPPGFGT
jgi:hypothetical protein